MKCRLLTLALLWLAALAQPALATDTVYYYYTDALHSTVVQADAQGNIVEQSTHYAPYGQVLNRSMRDGPGYTGHEEDPATGLNYMQQRYYDPQSGRFVSTDPILPTDNGEDFNRYEYANDNPYRYTDPDGRMFGVDDLAGFLIGGLVGMGVTAIENKLADKPITAGDMAGSFVQGGIEGVGLVNAPETGGVSAAIVYGGVAGAAGDATKQVFDKAGDSTAHIDVKEIATSGALGATIGAVTHGVADTGIPGISSGKNSMNAVGKAVTTRIRNGYAITMSAKTAFKKATGTQGAELGRRAVGDTIKNNLPDAEQLEGLHPKSACGNGGNGGNGCQ